MTKPKKATFSDLEAMARGETHPVRKVKIKPKKKSGGLSKKKFKEFQGGFKKATSGLGLNR